MSIFAPDAAPRVRTALELDASQRAVIALEDGVSASVIGAPGSGKTTTMIELVADRVLGRGYSPAEIVIITPTRASATLLRDRIASRLDTALPGALARTVTSLAFEIVRDAAARSGKAAPGLLTGAEQDRIIADLLAGEIEDGRGAPWPPHLDAEVRMLRGFRTELRDLMMRSVEYGVGPDRLSELGRTHDRPEWVAAGRFTALYDAVKTSFRGHHFDSSELVGEAVSIVEGRSAVVAGTAVGAGNALPPAIDSLRLVILDDAQESTASTVALVRSLSRRGVTVVSFGDPDVTTGSFRGAMAEFPGRLGSVLGCDVEYLYLGRVHRHGSTLRALVSAITQRTGAAASGQQRHAPAASEPAPRPLSAAESASEPACEPAPDPVTTADPITPMRHPAAAWTFDSAAEEAGFIARRLRERHLLDGVGWDRMAVVVRSGALVPALAQELQALEVATAVSSARTAVRDEFAVDALVRVIEVALGIAGSPAGRELDGIEAARLLCGAVGGLDAVALRRLRAALRHEELAGGGDRSADELLVESLELPAALTTIDTRVGGAALGLASNLRATVDAVTAGDTIEELLWGVWERSGRAAVWLEQALGSGLVADEANHHLDAVVALFSAAKRFVERTPDAPASVFLDSWRSADVAEDTLAPRALLDAVTVATPSAVVGREFDVVVIAGMQENVWPNVRIRGSLLAAQDLPLVLEGSDPGIIDRRLDVMHDELRMFALAVSRARAEVIVTAVAAEDTLPSPFLRLLPEGERDGLDRHPLSLRGVTGRLRRELTANNSADAAAGLARLAAEGVPGANPDDWYGMRAPSTTEPLVDLGEQDASVRVSPSRMEAYEACALHWLIDRIGGGSSNTASNLGTIIHAVAEATTDPDSEKLFAAVKERWGELQFEAPWHSEVEQGRARDLTRRLAAYFADFAAAGGELMSVEPKFELQVGRAVLSGRIDRVETYPDGTAVIVDLKTGKGDPTSDAGVADNAQLGAYQLAFASAAIEGVPDGLGNGGAKLVIVSKGARGLPYSSPHQAAFTAEELDEFRKRVMDDAQGMAGAVFVAQLGSHCLDPWSFGSCRIHVVPAVSS